MKTNEFCEGILKKSKRGELRKSMEHRMKVCGRGNCKKKVPP